MSDLTSCNYCKYKAIKKFQKKCGNRLIIVPSKGMEQMGGYEIHALKKNEKLTKGNWIAWMQEITDYCVC